MNISRPGRLLSTTLSLAALSAAPVLAQDGPGAVNTLSFSTGLEVSDNPSLSATPDGTVTSSVTRLGYRLNSETRTQKLGFNLGTVLEGAIGSGTDSTDNFRLTSKTVGVNYAREGANSSLAFDASFSDTEFDDEAIGFFVDGVFDPDGLIIDGGSRERFSYGIRYQFGTGGPLSLDLRFRDTAIDYVDTTDPDLVSFDATSIDATARFRINPAVSGRFVTGQSRKSEEDTDTVRKSKYIGAGIEGETASGLSYFVDLTQDDSETIKTGSVDSADDGLGLSFGATQDMPDGDIGIELSSRIDDSGRRNRAEISRSYDLPAGALALSLGVVDQNDDTEVVTRLSYSREGDGSAFSANLVQRPTTEDGTGFLNTSLQVNYSQDLSPVSSLGAGVTYGSASEFGGSGSDTRTSASVTYRRSLTQDWSLRTGVEHTRIDEDGGDNVSRNTIFLNVGRDFSFGF